MPASRTDDLHPIIEREVERLSYATKGPGSLGRRNLILQRSAASLGAMPAAVGRYMSANGDRISMAAVDESKLRDLLGLERAPGVAYDAIPIGKPISAMTFDYLDRTRPEFTRFGPASMGQLRYEIAPETQHRARRLDAAWWARIPIAVGRSRIVHVC